jgi:hypothetical protein
LVLTAANHAAHQPAAFREIIMTTTTVKRLCRLLPLAVLSSTCLAAAPGPAMPPGPPPGMGAGSPMAAPLPPLTDEALGLTPAQSRLLQAARHASHEAQAHALELHARFLRDTADMAPDAPLRPRLQAQDRLHEALEQDRRAVREQWLALDDSLDASQRRRLRGSPEVAHSLGLMPPHGMGPGMPDGLPPGPPR